MDIRGDLTCAGCGASNGVGARFCNQCAAPLGESPTAVDPAAAHEERRQITVLFSDASGYTEMAEHLDAEVVREVMKLVYEQADRIVEKYGGRIDKLMGDAVLAVFGDPVVHEDDAERAVRAAMELHAAVEGMRPEFEARVGRAIAMHSGINSGVVITSDLSGDRASGPLGDMVNVASRLQSIAKESEILIGPETRSLVHGRFELTDLGERELKGRREPVRVTRVDGFVAERGAPSRRSGVFIGRQEELGVLIDAVDRLRDRESALITVCADAGAGKSRLLEEVRARLDPDVQWLEGRAYPYTTNIPYAPVIDLLNRAAGIDERDTSEQVRAKLEAMVARNLPGDDRTMVALAHLYDLTPAESAVDLEAFRSLLLAALTALVDVVARRAPTVVCLQDLHWVDPSTADLVRDLAAAVSEPVVMVCNFRPGFSLGASSERVLHLGEMSQRQTREQLVSLLDGEDAPDDLVDVVIARTDGNPFFVEEIVNSLIETDVLVREAGGWVLRRRLDDAAVPGTIRGLIAARIDNLDPHRRRVLREVSVVGREFLYGLVQSVTATPDQLDRSLADLAAADLIREKSTDPELEYIFKHALTQEVAYDGLLRRERQELHERVAQAIEALLGDRTGEFVETLAYHYERSGHVVEAVNYLRRAGRKALDRYAIAEAHAHYESAYSLLTANESETDSTADLERDRLLLELILDWAYVHYYTAEFNEICRLQTLHHDLPDRVGDDRLTARWIAWAGHAAFLHMADMARSRQLLDEALALGERCNDPTAQALALGWLPWTLWLAGDTARGVTLWPRLEALLPHVPDPHDRRYAHIKGLGGFAVSAGIRGETHAARTRARELIHIGERTGNRRAAAMGHGGLVFVNIVLGNQSDAIDETVATTACEADPIYALSAALWSAGINALFGDPNHAQQTCDEWRPFTERFGLTASTDNFDAFTAMLAVSSGQLSRGMRDLAAVRERSERAGNDNLCGFIDLFLAMLYARIATGEASGSLGAALRNPGFVLRYARGAAKRGRAALEELAATLDDRGFGGYRAMVELELAKLAVHERRTDDARAHLHRVQELLADEPDATLVRDAAAMLAVR
jgi:class 3 adenylate cyclase